MKKKLAQIAFSGTPEQLSKLDRIIEQNRNDKGASMPILQGAQEIYGYLPVEVIRHIAVSLGLPYEEIYGIATFYSQFSLSPKGKVAVAVCLGTACYVKGAGKIMDRLSELLHIGADETSADGKFSLEATRCIGACGLAPVLTVNNTVFGRLEAKDVDGIVAQYMKD